MDAEPRKKMALRVSNAPRWPLLLLLLCSHWVASKRVRWNCSATPRIAVCHYGLFRDLRHTLPSLIANVHTPLRSQLGGVDIFVHALLIPTINHKRSGEVSSALDPAEFFGISPACRYAAEDQDEVDYRLARIRSKTDDRKPTFAEIPGDHVYDLAVTRNALRGMYESTTATTSHRPLFYHAASIALTNASAPRGSGTRSEGRPTW